MTYLVGLGNLVHMDITLVKKLRYSTANSPWVSFVKSLAEARKLVQELGSTSAQTRFEHLVVATKFAGNANQMIVLPVSSETVEVVILIGIGNISSLQAEAVRTGVGSAVKIAQNNHYQELIFDLNDRRFATVNFLQLITTAATLAQYQFTKYKQPDNNPSLKIEIALPDSKLFLAGKKAVTQAYAVGAATNLARDLVNTPALDLTPDSLVNTATTIAQSSNGTVTLSVLDRSACTELGMGAYMAVAAGAEREPKFIHLTYTPKSAGKLQKKSPDQKTIALVGKGITFDSGGLSLKPSDGMMTMKCDMAGAATVLAIFKLLAEFGAKHILHGFIAATENMPSSKAIRPGDVVTALNGKTIEILNTDAEGRLTLADAITYAKKFNPDTIIDLATLTGACVVALGEEIAGLMTTDKALSKELLQSASLVGEKLWPLPLEPRYAELNKSSIADYRNIPTNRYGGALTAGLFLQPFAEGVSWAHLDIAGPAFAEKPLSSYLDKGASGYGVRTIWEWLH